MQQAESKRVSPRSWRFSRRMWAGLIISLSGLIVAYPILGGWLGLQIFVGRVAERLKVDVHATRARTTWSGALCIQGLSIESVPRDGARDGVRPGIRGDHVALRLYVEEVEIPFAALSGGGRIRVLGPRLLAGGLEALRVLWTRLRGGDVVPEVRGAQVAGRQPAGRRVPRIEFERAFAEIGGPGQQHLFIRDMRGFFEQGRVLVVELHGLAGDLRQTSEGVAGFGAQRMSLTVALRGGHPDGLPIVTIEDGYAQLSPHLGLSGITGSIERDPNDGGTARIALRGSYGGAREFLWRAEGSVRPARELLHSRAQLVLRAERFLLARIREVLPPYFIEPERTSLDADLTLDADDGRIRVRGGVRVSELGLFHPGLASEAVRGLNISGELDATVNLNDRSAHVEQLVVRLGDLAARLEGRLALHEGPFIYGNGQKIPWTPSVDLVLDVPKMSCKRLLGSFPDSLVPHLRGFELRGDFETHLALSVDFTNLDALALKGKVGIDGCRVQSAPEHIKQLADREAILAREVEVPPAWNDTRDAPETLVYLLGPDNEDFVPYDQIGPHVINAVLTTEDSRFFQHRGFAVAEFRTALRRNLAEGSFRLGASSITMQSVKNLLLSHEKTLSRKLQELFLVWYLEQILSKERILELYFNAIEFGPRLYGIGPAARHYFGKRPAELTPPEAAFIASLLPSPKRRYAQYCRGTLSPDWLRYIRRVLTRMRERDRLTEEEYAQAMQTVPVFDLSARDMDERECLEWVRRVTQRIDEPSGDVPEGEP